MAIENTQGYQILHSLLTAFNQDTKTVLALFDPDAIVEYPYAAAIGRPHRLTMDDYRKHLDNILGHMPDISFTRLQLYPLQEEGSYWAEFHGETRGSCYRSTLRAGLCRSIHIKRWKIQFL